MPILKRYSNIKNGAIEFIGNTLGLSKAVNSNSAGTQGSIGAFISPDNTLQVNNFPLGTTSDYTKNGSSANLNLLQGSTILYAELIWGGLFRSSAENISALLNNPIDLITPSGTFSVAPDPATQQQFNIQSGNITIGFYVRSANVTEIVKSSMNGKYTAAKIPALIEAIDARTSETNHAGWTLCIAYENSALPLRNLTLWCGGTVVSPTVGSTDINLTGFITPENLPISGRLFVSAQEGDAVIPGDQMLFGKDLASLSVLSGPNNPQGNFFASQINNSSGTLETSGSFGLRNANAQSGLNTLACRQGWDITSVNVSPFLTTSMTTAAIRFTTTGDLYVPNGIGLQIDSKGARINIVKQADRTFVETGSSVKYSLTVKNTGTIKADSVLIDDVISGSGEIVLGSLTVNGQPSGNSFPLQIGPVNIGEEKFVEFLVVYPETGLQNPVLNKATTEYSFQPFPGYVVESFSESNTVSVIIVDPEISAEKSVDKSFALKGEKLFYKSEFINIGNILLKNIMFTDPIPDNTEFEQGSVEINGVSYPQLDPSVSFLLPDLQPGEKASVTFFVNIIGEGVNNMIVENQSGVTFDYVLPDQSVKSGEQNSNIVKTEILSYAIEKLKSSDKTFLNEGENAVQKVEVKNNSTATLFAMEFKDVMSEGAAYVPGSVMVNGVSQASYDPVAGFTLPDLASGESHKIEYTIQSNNPKTKNFVTNTGVINYSVEDPLRGPVAYSEPTNEVSLVMVSSRIMVEKSVDKSYAVTGENLHYVSDITNTGTMTKINLVFKDAIPAGTVFVPGSVTIDGVSYPAYNPADGFSLPDLNPGNSVKVEFDVTVI